VRCRSLHRYLSNFLSWLLDPWSVSGVTANQQLQLAIRSSILRRLLLCAPLKGVPDGARILGQVQMLLIDFKQS
jgi:hypothetical protein